MTPEMAIDIFRHTLHADVLAGAAAARDRIRGRDRGQPGAGADFHSGHRFASVPRLAAFLFGLLLLLPWMTAKLVSFTTGLFGDFSRYAR